MDKFIQDEIEKYMEALQADGYKRGVDWKGYEVYEPIFKEMQYTGVPLVVIVKDKKIRLTTTEESYKYLRYSQKVSEQN